MISCEDKNDHPVFYWMLLLLLALCAFQLFSIVAEGAFTASTYNTTDESTSYQSEPVHTKDDYLVFAYRNSNADLMIAYKKSAAGSWSYAEIASVDWNGGAQYFLHVSVKITSNNTILVFGYAKDGAYYMPILWAKYPGSDWGDWSYRWIHTGSTASAIDMAVNNTDMILCIYRIGGANLNYKIYDLENETVIDTAQWVSSDNSWGQCEANQSGVFFIAYRLVTQYWYIQDVDKLTTQRQISSIYIIGNDLVCLANDRFIFTGYMKSGIQRKPMYYYQSSHLGTFAQIYLVTYYNHYWSSYCGISISQGSNTPYIYWFDDTDKKLYQFTASFDAAEATWQSSKTEVGADADSLDIHHGSTAIWPKVAGLSYCQPKTGQAFNLRDEDGATDKLQYWYQDVTWTPDLTTAWPEITTISLPAGTYGTYYEYTMSKTGGTPPYIWSILSGPAWLSIGPTNGTIYGQPTGVGTASVTIKLADAIPRSDEESYSLTINPVISPVIPPTEETFSFESLHLGDLWIVLACVSIGVGLSRIMARTNR